MTQSVVGASLDGIGEDLVCLRDGGKLRPGPLVVVDVGVVDPNLLAVGILDLVTGCVGRDVEKVVEVLGHGSGCTVVCTGLVVERL